MIQLKWFPPSWVQIRIKQARMHIDPSFLKTYYAKHPTVIEYSSWPDPVDGLPEPLEPANIILVTHHHKDHLKKVTVNRLRGPNTVVFGPATCSNELGHDFTVVAEGDNFTQMDFSVKTVPAYNTAEGSSTKKNHKPGKGLGYLVTVGGVVLYHAGDTDLIPEMSALGRVDVALLPIGGTYTMNVAEAARAVSIIKPKLVIPVHHLSADPGEFCRLVHDASVARAINPGIGKPIKLESEIER
jgi:L-ascorbate metabolism protein UlaG (beta-lactamase superfamily)